MFNEFRISTELAEEFRFSVFSILSYFLINIVFNFLFISEFSLRKKQSILESFRSIMVCKCIMKLFECKWNQ